MGELHNDGKDKAPDRVRSSSGAQFDRLQFRIRLVIVAALALGALALPVVGDNHLTVGLFLGLVILPAHFVIRRIVGTPNPTGWLDLLAILAAVGTSFIEPDAFAPAFAFQLLNVSGAVAFLTHRWVRTLAVTTMVTMPAVALIRPVDAVALPMIVVAGVYLPALVIGASQKMAKEQRSSRRIQSVVSGLSVLVWEADAKTGHMHSIVGDTKRVLGASRSTLLGSGYLDRVHAADQPTFRTRFAAETDQPDLDRHTYRFVRGPDDVIWLTEHVSVVSMRGQRMVRGVIIDITAERQAKQSVVRQSEIVQRMSAASIVVDRPHNLAKATVLVATDPLGILLASARSAEGLPLREVAPGLMGQPWLLDGLRRLDTGTTVHTGPHLIPGAMGDEISVEVQLFSLPDGTAAMVIDDVSERVRSHATIKRQATHDELTGLPNRSHLMTEMQRRLARGEAFSLALIDLNRFKDVNDALGHSTGDELLRVIAHRLANAVGRDDMVARLGGDEFAVVLGAEQHINDRINRITAACRDRVTVTAGGSEGTALAIGASIGVASAPHHAHDGENLLRFADIAMYEAKRSRQRVMRYEPDERLDADRLELMADLGDAFTLGQFVPYFQPKVEIATGEIVGAEVLARWEHPTRGLLLPADFMEIVALAGHLDDLMKAMVWAASDMLSQLPDNLSLSVNVSAVNLRQPDLAAVFAETLRSFAVDPRRLTVELTEAEFADDSGVLQTALHELADLGIGVSVDDFGTGFSPLTHLQTLPLTELKIDRRFVADIATSNTDRTIVQALVTMAKGLGVKSIAEGIEDQRTLEILGSLGCELAQGYFTGRPMPAAGFSDRCVTITLDHS